MKIIDTRPIMERLKEEYKHEISKLPTKPKFTIVSVGNVSSNEVYVRNKLKHCEEVGIDVRHITLPKTVKERDLINTINTAQYNSDSIILQLPLDCDNEINIDDVLNRIDAHKDVDGLTVHNQGRLHTGNPLLIPATPKAIMKFLKEIDYNVEGRNVAIIGRSTLVGSSLAALMTQANATVTLLHSKSDDSVFCDIEEGMFDVVVSCVGKPLQFKNINADVIIDVGINFLDGKMVGDIDIGNCSYKYATIPPSKDRGIRGGIGSLTCMALISNVIASYKLQHGLGGVDL